jgi:hypothetical protein
MAGDLVLNMLNNVAFGVVEAQTQLATGGDSRLLSMRADQGINHVVDKAYHCEQDGLWQQVHNDEFLPVDEECQH